MSTDVPGAAQIGGYRALGADQRLSQNVTCSSADERPDRRIGVARRECAWIAGGAQIIRYGASAFAFGSLLPEANLQWDGGAALGGR
jgi:hypothetical protein